MLTLKVPTALDTTNADTVLQILLMEARMIDICWAPSVTNE